jgi:hypothetical protein
MSVPIQGHMKHKLLKRQSAVAPFTTETVPNLLLTQYLIYYSPRPRARLLVSAYLRTHETQESI